MAPFTVEPESTGRTREITAAGIVLVVALATSYLPQSTQQGLSAVLHATVLRPFLATQERFEASRISAARADSLTALVDSLTADLTTHEALNDENRRLRGLLELSERAGPSFLPANILRPGTPGSESMFLVDVGASDGVRPGAPVVSPDGLVGRILEVRPRNAVGMDWTHPDFRASAMIADGSAYGLVENRPGRFREDDRLLLNGVAYNQPVSGGALVVTSGLGGLYPRGIPIGTIDELRDEQGSWRRSYWLVPRVEPAAATHVLVVTPHAGLDVDSLWTLPALPLPEGVFQADTLPTDTLPSTPSDDDTPTGTEADAAEGVGVPAGAATR